nr:DUF2167 domain-containing protein [Candidatus Krumholzibacteria bacterium]
LRMPRAATLLLLAATILTCPALAQDQQEGGLDWIYGPTTAPLGQVAEIDVPDGYQFVAGQGTRDLLEYFENPTNGHELGLIMPMPGDDGVMPWFVVFEYDASGYVKDDEKDNLDADAILAGIREGNAHANKVRRERGWETIEVVGWQTAPYYDPETNNLKWAIIGSSSGGQSVNFSTRLLGRGGTMSADLVAGPDQFYTCLPDYEAVMTGYRFTEGHRYAEFRKGDKVAKYGLTALVAGGVGAVAMKTGLLARFWKFIVLGVVAFFGFIRRAIGGLFGRGKQASPEEPPVMMAEVVEPDEDPATEEPKRLDPPE